MKKFLLAAALFIIPVSANAQVGIPPIGYSGGSGGSGGGGSGTVTTTGSPASGNIAAFSGASSITNTDLTGDATTSGTNAVTVNSYNGGTPLGAAAAEDLGSRVIDNSGSLDVQKATDAQLGIVQVDGTSIVADVNGVISAATGSGNAVISPATGNVDGDAVCVDGTTTGIKDCGAPPALSTTTHTVTGAVAVTAAQFTNQDPWQIKATATITLPQSNGTPTLNNGLVLFQNTGVYVPTFAINAGDCIKVAGDAACRTTGASYVGTANYSYLISSDGSGTIFIEPISPSVSGSSGLTVGTTTIASGTTLRVLYDLAGVLGEMTTSGSGTQLALTNSPTFTAPVLGTVAAGSILTNATGLPVSTGVSGLGTGIATALGVSVGSAGAPVVNGGALGTPSSGTLTSAIGLPISSGVSGLGTGVATALGVNVGTAGAPVVNGGALGTPSSGVATNITGCAISACVSGLGTGVATALGTAVGSAGAPVVNGGVLGTPSSGVGTNLTALNASNLSSGTVAAARMPAFTGDVTTSAGAVATTLATVNSNVGTYGDATHCSNFTVNDKGLITAAAQSTSCPGSGGSAIDRTAISGRYYWARRFVAAAGTTVGTGAIKWMPWVTNQTMSLNSAGLRVTTGVGSSTCDILLYSSNASGLPGSKIASVSTQSSATSGSIINNSWDDAVDHTVTAGTAYWWGVTCSASGVIFESSATSNANNGYIAGALSPSNLASGSAVATVSYSSTYTYGAALPTDPTITEGSAATQAEIFFGIT